MENINCNHELKEGEVWLANTNVRKALEVPSYLKVLRTIRLGEQAYDINGNKIEQDYMRPLIIHKSESKAYDKIMMARVKAIGRVVTRIG